jgi:hypothetical protein
MDVVCFFDMNVRRWIALSGFIWAAVGLMLLYKGLQFLSAVPDRDKATWFIAGGLLVGFIKGRFVLSKTVRRISDRIASLPQPIRFADVYPKSYWLLLAAMMGVGLLMRFVPLEWRGLVDVAVGSALINGAMLYFRAARSLVVRGS